jgi:hypothetical protein
MVMMVATLAWPSSEAEAAQAGGAWPGVQSFLFSRVMVSEDAGISWSDTGFGGELVINDLKLGIDGRNLYASTGNGIWRLPIPAGS